MPDPASKLRLELGPSRLSATLIIEPGARAGELDEATVGAFLFEHGLPHDPDRAPRIRTLLAAHSAAPDERHSAVIAEGFPPKDGVDGRFELEEGLRHHGAATTEAGTVDHYASRIEGTVRRGTMLGRILPPVDGFDGFDVFGECVASRPARPTPLTFDDSIERSEDGILVAAVGGIIELTAGSIRVNPTLELRGNVDFSTGSIDFPGDVVVMGDVRDCFSVKTGRDLTVHHLVDGATLEAERDCHLLHGMATRQNHTLKVGRDLHARYLSGVECEVGRNAHIDADITHCRMKVKGELIGPECCVVRGVLDVNLACEIRDLGSEASVETTLRLATEDRASILLDRGDQLLHTISARLGRAQDRLKDLRSVHGRMTSSQADALTELTFESEQLGSMASRLRKSMDNLRALPSVGSKVSLVVHRMVHRHSVIFLGAYRIDFRESLHGPIRVRLDAAGRPVFLDFTTGEPLPQPAAAHIELAQPAENSEHKHPAEAKAA